MSRSIASTSLAALRAAFPFASSFSSTSSSSSSTRLFSTSTPSSMKQSHKHKDPHVTPRRQWRAIREKREAAAPRKAENFSEPDYILGHIKALPNAQGRVTGKPIISDPWEGCRLSKVLIHPQSIWNSPLPDYAAGEKPKFILPGLSKSDEEMVFGAVPHATTLLQIDTNNQEDVKEQIMNEAMANQEKQTEMLSRILDLRNAGRAQINAMNRRRVIEEFGAGKDCGSSFVQVALLTMRIRGLNEHVLEKRKDIANRTVMRRAIMDRARHLKYIKRKWPGDYPKILADVGLDPRAVEGELKTRL